VNTPPLGTPKSNRPGITRVVAFVSDRGYVAQALIAASQLAAQPDVAAIADIIIYLIDIPEEEQRAIQAALVPARFNFRFLDSRRFLSDSVIRLPPLHCPSSTLGRLVIDAEIPAHYDTVIYIDGDVQIVGPAAALIGFDCPPDTLLAGADRLDNGGRYANPPAYLKGIGIDRVADYFNAGVMMARRETWRRLTSAALRFLAENPERCKHHDQSALNAVLNAPGGPRRMMLHPRFNYSTWFRLADRARTIAPSIVHFTGPIKPWNTTSGPWEPTHRQVYADFLARYPYFARYLTVDASRTIYSKYRSGSPLMQARLLLKSGKEALEHRWQALLLKRFAQRTLFSPRD
jgi:lipopolysaccharide biosynthesis glycosyltransferase